MNIIAELGREFLPKQIETMEAVKKYRYVLYSGAVRAGKTLIADHIAIQTCIENPGCQGFIGSLTTTQLSDVVFKVFEQELKYYQDILDKNNIPITLVAMRYSKGDMKAIFYNGSEIVFRHCEQEQKIRGKTLDFVILDEPIEMNEEIFHQLMQRISGGHIKNPFILLTTNPGAQSHWIYKHFYKKATEEYYTIETTTYDNILLPQYKKYIKNLEDNLDEDWILRFLNGRWGAYSGQIYKDFNINKHTGDYTNFKNFKYINIGVDWGNKNPSCVLVTGITSDKHVYVIKEWYKRGATTPQVAKKIAEFYKEFEAKKVFVDASQPDLILQTKDLKVNCEKSERNVSARIGKIRGLLKNDMLHIDINECPNLIREMEAYRWKKDSEEPIQEDDHAPDALGYALTDYRSFRRENLLGFTKRDLWDF